MLRWVLFTAVGLMLMQWAWPWLNRFGIGRLPLDWRFRTFGREWVLPIGSSLVLTAIVMFVERLFWHWM